MAEVSGYRMLIGGRLEEGEAQPFDVINPANGDILAICPSASPEQANRALMAAEDAFGGWRTRDRDSFMLTCADIIDANAEELAVLLTREKGSPLFITRAELAMSSAFFRAIVSQVTHDRSDSPAEAPVQVIRQPLGVVVAITPWNGPLALGAMKLAPALFAGNTVVLKPSPHAPLSSLRLAGLLADVLPTGVLNVITGDDALGACLVSHPIPRKISFTGSTRAGRSVLTGAAQTLKRVTLELGGNDPAIVMEDADVGSTADALAMACMINSGQACALPKRIFVPEHLKADFVDALRASVEALKVGDGLEEGVFVGPLTTAMQRDRVESLVSSAAAAGGRIVCGGKRAGEAGYFYLPTIVTGLDDTASLVAEEQFGPAIPVLGYSTQAEVLERANRTEFGLGGSVWTRDVESAMALVEGLECGNVGINQHGYLTPDLPFGGWKQSGIGVENGREGFEEFTAPKLIAVRYADS